MTGAPALAGLAALRSGAGLVTVASAETAVPTIAGYSPCLMTVPLGSDAAGRIDPSASQPLDAAIARATVVVIGPGMGRSPGLDRWVRQLVSDIAAPMIVDADGLNALARLDASLGPRASAARIMTPHPGEFARLVGSKPSTREESERLAIDVAERYGWIVVLKGHQTLVTDGRSVRRNTTGNPGMATGGTGDVLSGVIAALVAQGLNPFDAAVLGAHVHGLAGDLAARRLGEPSLVATDVIDELAAALKIVS
jgi:NAD(P)H-hydrate epimerase